MKINLGAVFGISTLVLVAACSGGVDSASEQDEADDGSVESADPETSVKSSDETGAMVFPQQTGVPPWAFVDEAGDLAGMLPDMSAPLATVLGVEIVNEQTTWENSLLGIDQEKYPTAPGADVNKERLEKYDFAIALKDGYSFQVKAGNPEIGDQMQDLCGLTIGLPAGSSPIPALEDQSDKCVENGEPEITLSTFPDWAGADLAAQSGQVDATSSTLSAIEYQARENPGKWVVTGPVYNEIEIGYIVPKGDPLGPKLVDAINEIIKNGEYQKIFEEYGTTGMAVSESKLVTE